MASPDREDDPEPTQEAEALQTLAQTLSEALRDGTLTVETPIDAVKFWLGRVVSVRFRRSCRRSDRKNPQ